MQQVKELVEEYSYIGKQEHEKLYIRDQPHQEFSIMLTLCVAL